jgi:hypothetical protein
MGRGAEDGDGRQGRGTGGGGAAERLAAEHADNMPRSKPPQQAGVLQQIPTKELRDLE